MTNLSYCQMRWVLRIILFSMIISEATIAQYQLKVPVVFDQPSPACQFLSYKEIEGQSNGHSDMAKVVDYLNQYHQDNSIFGKDQLFWISSGEMMAQPAKISFKAMPVRSESVEWLPSYLKNELSVEEQNRERDNYVIVSAALFPGAKKVLDLSKIYVQRSEQPGELVSLPAMLKLTSCRSYPVKVINQWQLEQFQKIFQHWLVGVFEPVDWIAPAYVIDDASRLIGNKDRLPLIRNLQYQWIKALNVQQAELVGKIKNKIFNFFKTQKKESAVIEIKVYPSFRILPKINLISGLERKGANTVIWERQYDVAVTVQSKLSGNLIVNEYWNAYIPVRTALNVNGTSTEFKSPNELIITNDNGLQGKSKPAGTNSSFGYSCVVETNQEAIIHTRINDSTIKLVSGTNLSNKLIIPTTIEFLREVGELSNSGALNGPAKKVITEEKTDPKLYVNSDKIEVKARVMCGIWEAMTR